MKPSARLRTLPRSASDNCANGAPWTSTSPALGASSPPSRCKSVLLPEPDAPTIARRSPGATARSIPSSTGTSSGPLRYVFRKPRHSSTAAAPTSLIAQRLRGIDLGRPPAGIQCREQREQQRDRGDQHDICALQIGRNLADVIDALVKKLDAERALDERHDDADVESQRDAADHAY